MNTTANEISKDDLSEDLQDPQEANLLWDEYKYRHDLIWQHLIRSTLVLVALLTLRYTTDFGHNVFLSIAAWLLAVGYILFTIFVILRELHLFRQIKYLHRKRQQSLFDLFPEVGRMPMRWIDDGFSTRVMVYLIVLCMLVFLAGPISLCNNQVKLGFICPVESSEKPQSFESDRGTAGSSS